MRRGDQKGFQRTEQSGAFGLVKGLHVEGLRLGFFRLYHGLNNYQQIGTLKRIYTDLWFRALYVHVPNTWVLRALALVVPMRVMGKYMTISVWYADHQGNTDPYMIRRCV